MRCLRYAVEEGQEDYLDQFEEGEGVSSAKELLGEQESKVVLLQDGQGELTKDEV